MQILSYYYTSLIKHRVQNPRRVTKVPSKVIHTMHSLVPRPSCVFNVTSISNTGRPGYEAIEIRMLAEV